MDARRFRTAALGVLAGLCCSTAVLADSQYNADRAYCNSSSNQEGKALCLKEASAAQGERGRMGSKSRDGMTRRADDQKVSADGSGKGVGERTHETAEKTRGFTHRQLEKARAFGARHAPDQASNEPNKEPAALGK